MKSKDLKMINLDGQDLYIVPTHLFSRIYESPYIDGERLMKHASLDRVVREMMEFVRNHEELFELSILQTPPMEGWFYIILLKQKEELIRVFIEKTTCRFCGCHFYCANHKQSSEIFFGLHNLETQQRILHKYPYYIKNCPNCDAKINRPAIWTEIIKVQ